MRIFPSRTLETPLIKSLGAALFVFLVSVVCAYAETHYVSDQLIVYLRQDKGSGDRLTALRTDTPVEVLEEAADGYVRVQTVDGLEGYVPAQYISAQIPKTVIIRELQDDVKQLQARIKSLSNNKAALRIESHRKELEIAKSKLAQETASFQQRVKAEQVERERLQKELLQLTQKHNALLEETRHSERLKRENLQRQGRTSQAAISLAGSEKLRWFLSGGGIFLFGWIAGKFSKKKKYFSS